MKYLSILIFVLLLQNGFSQKVDTLMGNLEETVVTATRTERKLKNVAVPVIIIPQKIIQQSGSLRLNDILSEQTGLFITGGTGSGAVGGGIFGNGIQLQGLSPDYTMVLLDGEPLIGRQGGVMDLSRYAVGNIKKIEIIKGPASSLYGSEAMGGVVNIITAPLTGKNFQAGIRYGSFNTVDAHISSSQKINEKASVYYFFNRNSTSGYKLDDNRVENTLDPLYSYTAQIKFLYKLSANHQLSINSRYYYNWQTSNYAINSKTINIIGGAFQKDFTINPVLTSTVNKNIKNRVSLVYSTYHYNQQLDSVQNNAKYYADNFFQTFSRLENITDFNLGKHTITAGIGATLQTVNTTRYRDEKHQYIYHAFVQNEWKPINKINVISGLRFDNNTDYKSRISPKVAAKYNVSNAFNVTASFGYGFKAPDFRQLYLNFTNAAGDSYTLLGASEFSLPTLQQQLQQGLLDRILPTAFTISTLKPELSQGINVGFQYKHNKAFNIDFNFFRNDIDNLINYITVATKTNGAAVFSYVNINRAFTQGFEVNIHYTINKHLQIQAGYQLVETADKDVLAAVKNNQVFGRNERSGSSVLLSKNDYGGLLNRSRHMANARIFYNNTKGITASLRAIYRSKWGVTDVDGNGFANRNDEYADGMLQLHATMGKQLNEKWMLQVGVNNILNNINARYLPNAPSRNYFINIQYAINKNK